jgi:hypothetical protein
MKTIEAIVALWKEDIIDPSSAIWRIVRTLEWLVKEESNGR